MDLRFWTACAIGSAATRVLKRCLRRPAADFPGKAALLVDPRLIRTSRRRIREGSVVVVGTNGKTTVTNLLADAFELAGRTVACNRTGANLDSGVATALLQSGEVDWGVLECDELWLPKVLPQLQPDYVVLLNLFRDQLDRMGEIEHIQDGIASALASAPGAKLLYNCDDPLCQAVADTATNTAIPFGIDDDLGLPRNTVADAGFCQRCGHALEYRWRQYGQLGSYRCACCGFARAEPAFSAREVALSGDGISLTVRGKSLAMRVRSRLVGAYSAYNLLAACALAGCCNTPPDALRAALRAFAPDNGRLQRYEIDGCSVMLNLAKNPTGFNQSLQIVLDEPGPKAVAFFVNDGEADGRDVSWLWDVDFQDLADDGDLVAFAGGSRGNDVRVRLKYAGLDAPLVDGAADFVARARGASSAARFFVIANYTALPKAKEELDKMGRLPLPRMSPRGIRTGPVGGDPREGEEDSPGRERLVIAHLCPELLNLYGDGGNVVVLESRARRRGADVEVVRLGGEGEFGLADVDIAFIGGGPDREQRLASEGLLRHADELRAYVEDGGVVLAICGGYQILGRTWAMGGGEIEGLGILDIETRRARGGSRDRIVGDVVLESPLAATPVVGYENHAGRTFLGPACQPFGKVVGHRGRGNNGEDGTDGALYRNVLGTYLHGPLLAKNPEIADELVARALARRAAKGRRAAPGLAPLDDAAEHEANRFMRERPKARMRPPWKA